MAFDFPTSPTVGQIYNNYTWDGEKWLLRTGGSYARKNYIINGAMQVSQENGTTAGSSATVGFYYPVDMFIGATFGTAGTWSAQQIAAVTPAGSPNRLRLNVTAARTPAAGDLSWIETKIEGLRSADLRLGTASAKIFTLQFGVRAPAGTYCVSFKNSATNRSYVAEYVISAGEANTDVTKTVTATGDVTGTWAIDNTTGLSVSWALMTGSTFQTSAGIWAAGNFLGTTNQFNFMGTGGNVFELFDVSLTEGTVAPPFVVPKYEEELDACQRYFETWETTGVQYKTLAVGGWTSTTAVNCMMYMKVRKRAAPSVSNNGTTNFVAAHGGGATPDAINALTLVSATNDTVMLTATATAAVGTVGQVAFIFQNGSVTAQMHFNARL